MTNKAILFILDGWGVGKHDSTDAVFKAGTPYMDKLMSVQPVSYLKTYGTNVGLPDGQMGNSEVGHMNIGAGRIVYQMLVRINKAFEDGSIRDLPGVENLLQQAKKSTGKIHFLGLVSDGGVHSSIDHLKGLCDLFTKEGLDDRVRIHCFTDGRDTDPHSAKKYISDLDRPEILGRSRIASVIGRYYAMDRDKRWERVKKAYDLMVNGVGDPQSSALAGVMSSYANHITDEFIEPVVIVNEDGAPVGQIEDGDIVVSFNFRTDRGRQITMALSQEAFHEYNMHPLDISYFTMTEYDKSFEKVEILFDNQDLEMTMGEYLAKVGLKQLRAAETEKYPHVTFFFSGGREEAYEGEDRVLIPSPKVATYDLQPEMSAPELTEAIAGAIRENKHDFMCVNFANPDMVGHTGVFEAIMKACETVDNSMEQLVPLATSNGYKVMIIADHGNADNAVNEDGSPNTAHSVNPVPCIIIGEADGTEIQDGILADVSPTILHMMGLDQPEEMSGRSLIVKGS